LTIVQTQKPRIGITLFILSALFVPLSISLAIVTGASALYFSIAMPSTASNLPPIEYAPFLILPLIGMWIAIWGRRYYNKHKIIIWAAFTVNFIYLGIFVYTFIDLWRSGRY
jgi:hypothetical protein